MTPVKRNASIVCCLAVLLTNALLVRTVALGQEQAPRIVHKSALLDSVISQTPPVYPALTGEAAKSVVINVVVGEEGSAISAGVVSGDRLLGWSAIEAVRRWRWSPALQDGLPARVVGLLSFTLNPDGSVTPSSVEPTGVFATGRATDAEILSDSAIALFKAAGEESRLFEQMPEVPIRINDSDEHRLFIEQAMVRGVKVAQPADGSADALSLIDDHSMRAILLLRNDTKMRVTRAEVRFTNREAHTTFLVQAEPDKSDTQDHYPRIISQMFVPGDPAGFEVEVASVQFEDEATRMSDSFPPGIPLPTAVDPRPPREAVAPQIPHPGGTQLPGTIRPPSLPVPAVPTAVDSRPMALNSPRPNYTEQARRNKVSGTTLLRLLVGADGSVKRVNFSTALPDFLTEEAIKAAYQIKFRPALKDGQPVAFWQAVEIEFNLR